MSVQPDRGSIADTRPHRHHPNGHAKAWRDHDNSETGPRECNCHHGLLYHGDPADPNTLTEECGRCDGSGVLR